MFLQFSSKGDTYFLVLAKKVVEVPGALVHSTSDCNAQAHLQQDHKTSLYHTFCIYTCVAYLLSKEWLLITSSVLPWHPCSSFPLQWCSAACDLASCTVIPGADVGQSRDNAMKHHHLFSLDFLAMSLFLPPHEGRGLNADIVLFIPAIIQALFKA